MNVVRVYEDDDYEVDYYKSEGKYRISIFDDGHFWDELWFYAYEEVESQSKNTVKDILRRIGIVKDV